MKSFAWTLWLRFFLMIGLGPGIGTGIGVAKSSNSVFLGVAAGLLASLVSMVIAAVWYRHVMRRRDPAFTYATYSLHAEATVSLALPADATFDVCLGALQALPGFFASDASREKLSITGATGGGNAGYFSFGSPGEKLYVKITAVTDASSTANIQSKSGIATVVLDFGKNKENIASITRFINRELQRRLDEITAVVARAETARALTLAKLNALQAQIEPHFLYNTLANAQLLTRSDAPRADMMLGHLIEFLRLSINDAEHSTLGQEVDRVVAYLEIMKIRMGDRLDYAVLFDDKIRTQPFAPLMLQTLVENAIKHGIEPKVGQGKVIICACVVADRLNVSVIDNGAGFSTATSGSGIGLKNISERLTLLYAGLAKLQLTPNAPPAAGMTATITTPLEIK